MLKTATLEVVLELLLHIPRQFRALRRRVHERPQKRPGPLAGVRCKWFYMRPRWGRVYTGITQTKKAYATTVS
jgi:hypothetical protein